ncbi:MAG: hypothetical protein R3F30_14605 [Planctomycetota bacterium]
MRSLLLALALLGPGAPAQAPAPASGPSARDLSPLAPADSLAVAELRSPAFALRSLQALARRLEADDGPLADLVPERVRRRLELGLAWSDRWPELAVGRMLDRVAHEGLLVGLRPGDGGPRPFAILQLAEDAHAEEAASVLRSWTLAVRVCGGRTCVLARTETELDGLAEAVAAAAGPARFAGASGDAGGDLVALRLWIGPAVLARTRDLPKLREDPGAAWFLCGLPEALRGSAGVVVEAGVDAGRGLRLRARFAGFAKALPAEARSVWTGGEALWPAEVPGTVLRFRVARDLAALVEHRRSLLDDAGQPPLDRFLQGLEFGFQGARAEDELLADLRPSTTGLLALGAAEDRVEERGLSYRLPRGLLSYGHGGSLLAAQLPQALRVLVVAGNAGRQRKGQAPYRIEDAGDEALAMATARVQSGLEPRPFGEVLRPTVGSTGKRLYVASSPGLVRAVVAEGETVALPAEARCTPLDRLEVDGTALAEGLEQNRDLVATRFVLDRGDSYAEARKLVDRLAALGRLLPGLAVWTGFDGDDLVLGLELETAPRLWDLDVLAGLLAEAGPRRPASRPRRTQGSSDEPAPRAGDELLRPFEPRPDRPWDRAAAAHLARRAALHTHPALLDRLLAAGSPQAGVAALLAGEASRRRAGRLQAALALVLAGSDMRDLQAWCWMQLLLDRHPLQARMALFWHDHFATGPTRSRSAAPGWPGSGRCSGASGWARSGRSSARSRGARR